MINKCVFVYVSLSRKGDFTRNQTLMFILGKAVPFIFTAR